MTSSTSSLLVWGTAGLLRGSHAACRASFGNRTLNGFEVVIPVASREAIKPAAPQLRQRGSTSHLGRHPFIFVLLFDVVSSAFIGRLLQGLFAARAVELLVRFRQVGQPMVLGITGDGTNICGGAPGFIAFQLTYRCPGIVIEESVGLLLERDQ